MLLVTANAAALTYCNPLNLNYRFQNNSPSRREAADPCVAVYKGEYFLFASATEGYWYSSDLIDWTMVVPTGLPLLRTYAIFGPAVVVIGDTMLYTAPDTSIYLTTDPKGGSWTRVTSWTLDGGDPAFLLDDDGRLYLYWGCSDSEPMRGIELDLNNNLAPIGSPVVLFNRDPSHHGWERPGDGNELAAAPWIEGSWVTKYNGVYYYQYAAPGTEYATYSDGLYTSSSPLGPYVYADYSPISHKTGGFIPSAGHSTTFQDAHGNWWRMSTMLVGVLEKFERRLGLSCTSRRRLATIRPLWPPARATICRKRSPGGCWCRTKSRRGPRLPLPAAARHWRSTKT
jgi:beta-xylosidase